MAHARQQPAHEDERQNRQSGQHGERRPPSGRVTQRRRQRNAEDQAGRGAAAGERQRAADICPRHQSWGVSDHQREEQRVRHPANRPSDRDNGECRCGGHQRVAQRVAQQGRQQQGLAGEPGGGDGQRHRERRDHHGIQADQQAGDRIRAPRTSRRYPVAAPQATPRWSPQGTTPTPTTAVPAGSREVLGR